MRDCCDEEEHRHGTKERKLRMTEREIETWADENRREKRERERKTDEYLALLQQEERGK